MTPSMAEQGKIEKSFMRYATSAINCLFVGTFSLDLYRVKFNVSKAYFCTSVPVFVSSYCVLNP